MSFDKNSAFNPRREWDFDPLSPLEHSPHSALERSGVSPRWQRHQAQEFPEQKPEVTYQDLDQWHRELERVISAVRAEVEVPRAGISPRIATVVDDYMMDLLELRDAIYSHLKG